MTLRGVIVSFIMTIVLSIMVLGYAALQQRIDIEGEANIDSTYKVQINSVKEKSATGDARSTSVFQYNGLSTTFHVGLTNMADTVTYEIEVDNLGTVDAILNNTEITIDGSNNMKVIKSGIRNGDILLANSLKVLTITVKLTEVTSLEQTANITINLDYTRLKGGTGEVVSDLPPGYRECEYIESTGAQYIDTSIYLTLDTEIESKFYFTSVVSGYPTPYGCKTPILGIHPSPNGYKTIFTGFGNNGDITYIGDITEYPRLYIHNKNGLWENGVKKVTYNNTAVTENSNAHIYIFSRWEINQVATRFSKIRLYKFIIRDNNSTYRDYIPVLDADNVPCLYDLISGETFYNQGTGDFLYKLKE